MTLLECASVNRPMAIAASRLKKSHGQTAGSVVSLYAARRPGIDLRAGRSTHAAPEYIRRGAFWQHIPGDTRDPPHRTMRRTGAAYASNVSRTLSDGRPDRPI